MNLACKSNGQVRSYNFVVLNLTQTICCNISCLPSDIVTGTLFIDNFSQQPSSNCFEWLTELHSEIIMRLMPVSYLWNLILDIITNTKPIVLFVWSTRYWSFHFEAMSEFSRSVLVLRLSWKWIGRGVEFFLSNLAVNWVMQFTWC